MFRGNSNVLCGRSADYLEREILSMPSTHNSVLAIAILPSYGLLAQQNPDAVQTKLKIRIDRLAPELLSVLQAPEDRFHSARKGAPVAARIPRNSYQHRASAKAANCRQCRSKRMRIGLSFKCLLHEVPIMSAILR